MSHEIVQLEICKLDVNQNKFTGNGRYYAPFTFYKSGKKYLINSS